MREISICFQLYLQPTFNERQSWLWEKHLPVRYVRQIPAVHRSVPAVLAYSLVAFLEPLFSLHHQPYRCLKREKEKTFLYMKNSRPQTLFEAVSPAVSLLTRWNLLRHEEAVVDPALCTTSSYPFLFFNTQAAKEESHVDCKFRSQLNF